LRRVDFGCDGEDRWYGGTDTAETFSLYDTLAVLAVSDVQAQGALSLASELEDKSTRIRAQLSVIKAVMKTDAQAVARD
jgi:capsule polysaccharide export protein KpsE/RkpR